MVDTVGVPVVYDRYFIPASKSILASADVNDTVPTLVTELVVVATKVGLAAFTACTVAAAFVT